MHSDAPPSTTLCPVCRNLGITVRKLQPDELLTRYRTYSGFEIPTALQTKYFTSEIEEEECSSCRLRWYSPGTLGDSDFYQFLGKNQGYYNSGSWDKKTAVQILGKLDCKTVVDVGCGDGWVLREARSKGFDIFGTEINRDAIESARTKNLPVFHPEDPVLSGRSADVLITLQTLEHIESPVDWIRDQVARFQPRFLIIAVPALDTTLGQSSDPLVWPPHHRTLWSSQALKKIGDLIGFNVVEFEYERNCWARFNSLLDKEADRRLCGGFRFPRGLLGRTLFHLLRSLKIPWVCNAHTVLALFEIRRTAG